MLRLVRVRRSSEKSLFDRLTAGTSEVDAGLRQRWFYNKVAKSLLLPLCNGRFESVDQDLPVGASEALKFLAQSLSGKDANALNPTTEETLITRITQSLSENAEWRIGNVLSVRLEKLQVVMGALRGEDMKNKTVVPLLGQFFVLENSDTSTLAELPMRQRLELLRKELHAGVVVQGEVSVKVDQVVQGESQTSVDHLIKLEASIIPHPDVATEFRPAATPHAQPPSEGVTFEATDWKIVDINRIMNGNFPIDFDPEE